MLRSPRSAWALGLGLLGLAAAVGRSSAQTGPATKSAEQPQPAAAVPAPRIGTLDMERVFREYKKFKAANDQFANDLQAKKAEIQKLVAQGQQIAKQLEELAPGSGTFKEKESEITRLKAQIEAEREQAQADFMRREAESLATIYKEVQAITAWVAKQKGLTHVIRVSAEPISSNDPNSVMAAMNRSVIYFDASTDITTLVVQSLNQVYDRQVGAQAPTDPNARPAAATTAPPASAPRTTTPRPTTTATPQPTTRR